MNRRLFLTIVITAVASLLIGTVIFQAGRSVKGFAANPVLKQADDLIDKQQLVEARSMLKKTIDESGNSALIEAATKKIEDLNIKILFSPEIDQCSAQYIVKPGDTLAKIAKEYGTTVELLMRSNGLDSSSIRIGEKFKVNTCKFSIFVDKSQNTLLLKVGEDVFKTYLISTGKNNSSPVGTFKIVNKLPNPTWFKTGAVIPADSPENILGTRWMGFDLKGFGIHGTTAPQDLGKQVTLGCVRMKNEEVEELYDIIPLGTEVTIQD